MVTRLHGMANLRNAACQQHFQHQPTVKRKVETGVPNAMSSLAPEDPGSILAIVSMKIRTGWLGHAKQVHIPTIAKVSDPWPRRQGPSRNAPYYTLLASYPGQGQAGKIRTARKLPYWEGARSAKKKISFHCEKIARLLGLMWSFEVPEGHWRSKRASS